MSKVYAGLLVVVALIAMAAIGTLALAVVTDVVIGTHYIETVWGRG